MYINKKGVDKDMIEKIKEREAIHESGHVVVAFYNKSEDFKLIQVEIVDKFNRGGFVRYDLSAYRSYNKEDNYKEGKCLDIAFVKAFIATCYGGSLAEEVLLGNSKYLASVKDRRLAKQIIKKYNKENPDQKLDKKIIKTIKKETLVFLEKYKQDILNITEALKKRKILTLKEIDKIIK